MSAGELPFLPFPPADDDVDRPPSILFLPLLPFWCQCMSPLICDDQRREDRPSVLEFRGQIDFSSFPLPRFPEINSVKECVGVGMRRFVAPSPSLASHKFLAHSGLFLPLFRNESMKRNSNGEDKRGGRSKWFWQDKQFKPPLFTCGHTRTRSLSHLCHCHTCIIPNNSLPVVTTLRPQPPPKNLS